MQGMNVDSIMTIIVSLLGGGVIGVIVKALTEKRKINAEATSTNVKSLLEIDQRMNERMANLEQRVANLEQENYKLKTDKLNLEKESHKLRSIIAELEAENKQLHADNLVLEQELAKFKEGEQK